MIKYEKTSKVAVDAIWTAGIGLSCCCLLKSDMWYGLQRFATYKNNKNIFKHIVFLGLNNEKILKTY